MQFSEKSDYGFAIGRVRAKETFLIRRSDYERLVNLNTEDELLSMVKEIWHLESSETATWETFLNTQQDENRKFFAKYCIDTIIKELFLESTIIKNGRLARYLENLNNEFLNEYFSVTVDLENLRSFIRTKHLLEKAKPEMSALRKLFLKTYLKNGKITEQTFTELLVEPWDVIIRWSENTPYRKCLAEGIDYLLTKKSFLRLERLIEEEKQKVLIKTRYVTFGYEPLVAFYLFKDNEIKNLRKIFYGIIEKTPQGQIRESISCIL